MEVTMEVMMEVMLEVMLVVMIMEVMMVVMIMEVMIMEVMVMEVMEMTTGIMVVITVDMDIPEDMESQQNMPIILIITMITYIHRQRLHHI